MGGGEGTRDRKLGVITTVCRLSPRFSEKHLEHFELAEFHEFLANRTSNLPYFAP